MKSSHWGLVVLAVGLAIGCSQKLPAPKALAPTQQPVAEESQQPAEFATVGKDEPPETIEGQPLSHWIERLHSDEQRERAQACGDLGRLGTEAKAAVPVLIDCLRKKELQPRWHFVNALGDIGPPAMPALIQGLKDDDKLVRDGVAVALGRIGPDAKAAVPALIEALESGSVLRQNAAEALKKIDPEAAKQAGVE